MPASSAVAPSTSTAALIPPAPKGLRINASDHATLIRAMLAANTATELQRTRNAVFAAYQPWIAQHALRSSPSSVATEDSVAEAYASSVGAIATYDPTSGVPLYQHLIEENGKHAEAMERAGSLIDIVRVPSGADRISTRSAWRTASTHDEMIVGETLASDAPGPEELALFADRVSDVEARLALLTPDHRQLLVSHYGLGGNSAVSVPDIALLRGITHSAAARAIKRAGKALAAAAPELRDRIGS